MRRLGLYTVYDSLLRSCTSLYELKQIHSSLTTLGFIVENSHLIARIIIKYAVLGDSRSARSVFNDISYPLDSFLWNTMIRAYAIANGGDQCSQALELYSRMRKTDISPDNYTFPFVLKACASGSLTVQGKLVHVDVIKTGFDTDVFVEAALLDMYAKCGQIDYSRRVFDRVQKRDLVCWTAMVTAYEQAERPQESLVLLHQMQREGLFADSITAISVASAVGQLGDSERAPSVHAYTIRRALSEDLCVGNSIIAMYAKCDRVEKARLVFDRMENRDYISWNSMLSGYTQNGLAGDALLLFDQMQASVSKPNPVTALIMVSACAYLGSRHHARKLHNVVNDSGIEINPTLCNAIMDMHAKCGDVDYAAEMFNRIRPDERNASSWNVLISAYGIHGRAKEALELYTRMQGEGVMPNHITFTSIISACSHARLVNEGRKCFEDMAKFSVTPEVKHYACMVDLLGRAGLLHEAFALIKDMPLQANDGVWGALLLACRIHGNTELGEIAAKSLFQIEPEHAGYYVLMSNIYAASSHWQEVVKLRQHMKKMELRKPAAFSVIEFGKEIHGFHTADQSNPYFREVYRKVESLAVEMKMAGHVPDLSCVLHDVEEEDKEQALNYHSEKLAVAMGIMKIEEGMEIQVTKNLRVCNDCHSAFKFVSGIYGRRIIVRDANRFHHFQGGTCSCNDYW